MNRTWIAGAVFLGLTGLASAQWTQWGSNGHYYGVFLIDGSDHSWSEARSQAMAKIAPNGLTGDLVSLTSAEENAFVFSLIDNPTYWTLNSFNHNVGPYIGAFQPNGSTEPGGGWSWSNGDAWSYTNWLPSEPNNFQNAEHVASFYVKSNARGSQWNDIQDTTNDVGVAYVVEVNPVPEPASLALLAGAGLALARRKKRA